MKKPAVLVSMALVLAAFRLGAQEAPVPLPVLGEKPPEPERLAPSIDIVSGDIPVGEFLRFLAAHTGLPVVVDASTGGDLEQAITIVAPIQGADEEIVRAILEAHGWIAVTKELEGGRKILSVTQRAAPPQTYPVRPTVATRRTTSRLPRPTATREGAPTAWKGDVLDLGAETVRRVEAHPSILTGDTAPDQAVTVAVSVAHVSPNVASNTVSQILSQAGLHDGMGFTPVDEPPKVIIHGPAGAVDYALRVLRVVDTAGEPRPAPITVVVPLKHASASEILPIVTELLARRIRRAGGPVAARPGRPMVRASVSDDGSVYVAVLPGDHVLVVESVDPGRIEDVKSLVATLDIPSPAEAEAAKPSTTPTEGPIQTRIISLRGRVDPNLANLISKLVDNEARLSGQGARLDRTLVLYDSRTANLIVQGTEENLERVCHMIEVLEEATGRGTAAEPEAHAEHAEE